MGISLDKNPRESVTVMDSKKVVISGFCTVRPLMERYPVMWGEQQFGSLSFGKDTDWIVIITWNFLYPDSWYPTNRFLAPNQWVLSWAFGVCGLDLGGEFDEEVESGASHSSASIFSCERRMELMESCDPLLCSVFLKYGFLCKNGVKGAGNAIGDCCCCCCCCADSCCAGSCARGLLGAGWLALASRSAAELCESSLIITEKS